MTYFQGTVGGEDHIVFTRGGLMPGGTNTGGAKIEDNLPEIFDKDAPGAAKDEFLRHWMDQHRLIGGPQKPYLPKDHINVTRGGLMPGSQTERSHLSRQDSRRASRQSRQNYRQSPKFQQSGQESGRPSALPPIQSQQTQQKPPIAIHPGRLLKCNGRVYRDLIASSIGYGTRHRYATDMKFDDVYSFYTDIHEHFPLEWNINT